MKNDIQRSCAEIPVPIDVYVGLFDHLRKHKMDCGPAPFVASIVQKYLDNDMANRPRQSSKVNETTLVGCCKRICNANWANSNSQLLHLSLQTLTAIWLIELGRCNSRRIRPRGWASYEMVLRYAIFAPDHLASFANNSKAPESFNAVATDQTPEKEDC